MIQGLILMVVGMGVVFTFLILMVLCMKGSSFLINKFAPYVEDVIPELGGSDLSKVAVAIAAAHHQNNK